MDTCDAIPYARIWEAARGRSPWAATSRPHSREDGGLPADAGAGCPRILFPPAGSVREPVGQGFFGQLDEAGGDGYRAGWSCGGFCYFHPHALNQSAYHAGYAAMERLADFARIAAAMTMAPGAVAA